MAITPLGLAGTCHSTGLLQYVDERRKIDEALLVKDDLMS